MGDRRYPTKKPKYIYKIGNKSMEWVNSWIQGIIIAVIISTIIEMILPQGNCKKYIKVVIGVYILFTIVSPVITKLSGNNFSLSNIIDLDEYVQASSSNTQEELELSQEEQIKNIYIDSLKGDMTEKIKSKGYEIISIDLEIADDEQYTLKQIDLSLQKLEEEENQNQEQSNNSIVNPIASVNEVEVRVENKGTNSQTGNTASSSNSTQSESDMKSNNTTQSGNNINSNNTVQSENNTDADKEKGLSTREQNELKEYLSGVYEIEKENIHIN